MYNKAIVFCLFLAFMTGCVTEHRDVKNDYSSPNPAECDIKSKPFFPLISWQTRAMDRSDIEEQIDCGITITVVTQPTELQFCEEYKQKVFVRGLDHLVFAAKKNVSDDVMKKEEAKLRKTLKLYRSNQLILGFCLWDEPGKATFPIYEKSLAVMKAECPDKIVYTNIFPNYSMPYQHGFKDYREYVENYCDLIAKYPDPLLVYDSYVNKNTYYGKSSKELLCKFLDNLETIRDVSQEKGMPFWNTVLAAAHDYHPDPERADIYWEVFTSLAYGSRGITYFFWHSRPAFAFQGGPTDIFHQKTPIWYYIRECNFQVRTLAPILMKLKSIGVFYSVIPADAALFTDFKKLPGRLVEDLKCELGRSNFLVGEFKHEDGSDWCMIVNLDVENIAHFRIKTVGNRKVQSYNNYLGTPCTLDTWLKPGQGKIYKIE